MARSYRQSLLQLTGSRVLQAGQATARHSLAAGDCAVVAAGAGPAAVQNLQIHRPGNNELVIS